MNRFMKTLTAAALLLAPTLAQAELEVHRLLTYKAWQTNLEVYPSGALACSAKTHNQYSETFDLTIDPQGRLEVWMFFNEEIPNDFVADIEVHIDYAGWTLYDVDFRRGTSGGAHAYFVFADAEKSVKFLTQIGRANVVALKTADGRQNYSTWSLAGSKRAINTHDGASSRFRSR